jgi:hypothetical protein
MALLGGSAADRQRYMLAWKYYNVAGEPAELTKRVPDSSSGRCRKWSRRSMQPAGL